MTVLIHSLTRFILFIFLALAVFAVPVFSLTVTLAEPLHEAYASDFIATYAVDETNPSPVTCTFLADSVRLEQRNNVVPSPTTTVSFMYSVGSTERQNHSFWAECTDGAQIVASLPSSVYVDGVHPIIFAPASDSIVDEEFTIEFRTEDQRNLALAEAQILNENKIAFSNVDDALDDPVYSFTHTLDTRLFPNGKYSLQLTSSDREQHQTTRVIEFTVFHQPPPVPDTDKDGIPNDKDEDKDNDRIPNSQDPDDNNDKVLDEHDSDDDRDGLADWEDLDDDGDGIVDTLDPDDNNDGIAEPESVMLSLKNSITSLHIPLWLWIILGIIVAIVIRWVRKLL